MAGRMKAVALAVVRVAAAAIAFAIRAAAGFLATAGSAAAMARKSTNRPSLTRSGVAILSVLSESVTTVTAVGNCTAPS